MRLAYLQTVLSGIEDILSGFDWDELSVTPDIFRTAVNLMAGYNLEGQDSIHLACMYQAGVMDLASFDRKLRRIDGLYLWNDLIHGA